MRRMVGLHSVALLTLCATVAVLQGKASQPVEGRPKTLKESVKGALRHADKKYLRLTGKVKVISPYVVAFEDGTEVDLRGAMDAPDLEQKGLIGDKLYPCGKEAAEFLKKLIGDQTVVCVVLNPDDRLGGRMRGACYVGEIWIPEVMIRQGWAISDHNSTVAAEIIARDNQRGLWRGEFIQPAEWRKGKRLVGE